MNRKPFAQEFDLIDVNGDGVISPPELRRGLLAQHWKPADVDALFAIIDENRDGRISRDEYLGHRGRVVFSAVAVSGTGSLRVHELGRRERDLCVRASVSLSVVGPSLAGEARVRTRPPARTHPRGRGRGARIRNKTAHARALARVGRGSDLTRGTCFLQVFLDVCLFPPARIPTPCSHPCHIRRLPYLTVHRPPASGVLKPTMVSIALDWIQP